MNYVPAPLSTTYSFSTHSSPDLETLFVAILSLVVVVIVLQVFALSVVKQQKAKTDNATSAANCRIIENAVVLEKNTSQSGWTQFTVENLDTHERTILRIDPAKNQDLATIQVGEKGQATMSTGAPHASTMGELLVAFVLKKQA